MYRRIVTGTLIGLGLLVTASVFRTAACAQSIHYPRNVERQHRHSGPRHGGYSFHAGVSPGFFYPGYPWLVGPYGFPSFSYSVYAPGYYGAYGVQYNSALNEANYWLPPVYAPAELMYGPKANNRFWGIETPVVPAPVAETPSSEFCVALSLRRRLRRTFARATMPREHGARDSSTLAMHCFASNDFTRHCNVTNLPLKQHPTCPPPTFDKGTH